MWQKHGEEENPNRFAKESFNGIPGERREVVMFCTSTAYVEAARRCMELENTHMERLCRQQFKRPLVVGSIFNTELVCIFMILILEWRLLLFWAG